LGGKFFLTRIHIVESDALCEMNTLRMITVTGFALIVVGFSGCETPKVRGPAQPLGPLLVGLRAEISAAPPSARVPVHLPGLLSAKPTNNSACGMVIIERGVVKVGLNE